MSKAITVSNVSKRFRVPLDRSTTLKYRVTHLRSSGRFHDLYALNDITFHVDAGEFLGVIGPNGCGKTTLLKILSRIYKPTRGVVNIEGRVSPFLELGVGFNPELTARENVFVNGAILGLTRGELDARFDSIIEFAGLWDFVDQKLKNFSSGMQVRLAFSVAIQAKAQILLMDEVLAVGDASFQEKCFDVFSRYKREGKTVVLVTHDLSAVEDYCDRALLLHHGRLSADGKASEVTAQYRRMTADQLGQAQSDHPLGEGSTGNRWGSGEVVITSVRVLDGSGKPVQTLTSGDELVVEMDYAGHVDVGEIVCGMALHRADGLHIDGSNTRIAGLVIDSPKPGRHGSAVYQVDRLALHAGRYLLSLSVYDRHCKHAYDEIQMEYPIRVVESTTTFGVVDLGGRWTVRRESERDRSVIREVANR